MRLLECTGDGFTFKDFDDPGTIPPYAILSHTWKTGEEVAFDELTNGTGRGKEGYKKIEFCGQQAKRDGLQYFWVDTCCINKANKAELSHAVNSMFRWYRNATRCYVYLSDVPSPPSNTNSDLDPRSWESDFQNSKWFTRGWTLQELLTPHSVEFFSREGRRLGDKRSLTQQIHTITGIPQVALEGEPLSRFNVNQRIPTIYGEGIARASKRLMDEIDKLEKCIQDLRATDPRDDKKRIENTKGGLLEDSYRWILENPDFRQWNNSQQSQLLCIKGDPGKGKTMLLCGIVDELKKSLAKTDLLSYFFCQATDARINNATAILRGLLYLLVDQQPSLISHIQKKHDHAGKALFEDANAWIALSEIFTNILQDPNLSSTYLVIDALDECMVDLPKLLDFIVELSSTSPRVKWIVSSRNGPDIEERLAKAGHRVRLSMELNAESVSAAVGVFIQRKVHQLARDKKYDDRTKEAVQHHLSSNADSTFLWVALVYENLKDVPKRNVIKKLNAFPPGLDPLYERMIQQMSSSDDADACKEILAIAATIYRPATLEELVTLTEQLQDVAHDAEAIQEIISHCGSFLTLRENTVYFVHQSAKDFLVTKTLDDIFPSGQGEVHRVLFARSLQVMSVSLKRDMYNLHAPGYPIEQVKVPQPDPLASLRYSCTYWVDHLCDWNLISSEADLVDLQDKGSVDKFLRRTYLHWVETTSLCKNMSKGVVSMAKLEGLVYVILERASYLRRINANIS